MASQLDAREQELQQREQELRAREAQVQEAQVRAMQHIFFKQHRCRREHSWLAVQYHVSKIKDHMSMCQAAFWDATHLRCACCVRAGRSGCSSCRGCSAAGGRPAAGAGRCTGDGRAAGGEERTRCQGQGSGPGAAGRHMRAHLLGFGCKHRSMQYRGLRALQCTAQIGGPGCWVWQQPAACLTNTCTGTDGQLACRTGIHACVVMLMAQRT